MEIMRYDKGKRKQIKGRKRALSVILCICIAFTSLSYWLQADPVMASELSEKAFVVTGFSELPDEVTEQSVPVGTPEEELELPDRLSATAFKEPDNSKQADVDRTTGELGLGGGKTNSEVNEAPLFSTQEAEETEKPSEEMPDETSGIAPEEMPGTAPEETPDTTPVETSGSVPEETPDTIPDETPGTIPEEIPGSAPEEIPGSAPEEIPGSAPEEIPGSAPEEIPGSTPEEIPGSTPEEIPGSASEEIPGSAPEETSGEPLEISGVGSDKTVTFKWTDPPFLTISRKQIPRVAIPKDAGESMPESTQTDITETEPMDEETLEREIQVSNVVIRNVIWDSSPLYDGDTPGIYLFTPSIPDNYCVEDEDCLPQIKVEVLEEQKTVEWVMAGIDALPSTDSIYENMPGDTDPEFNTWLTGLEQTLAEIRAVKEAYDALPDEEKELIGEESLNKLMDLSMLAERLSGMRRLNTERTEKWTDFAASAFEGGNGTENEPYEIANAAQLAYMATSEVVDSSPYPAFNNSVGKYYKITADTIDLSAHDWVPISTFCGSLDGGGCTITGMYCRENGLGYGLGLFGEVNPGENPEGAYSEIKDLHFEDCTIEVTTGGSRSNYVGILAGAVYEGSRISGCTVEQSTISLAGNSGGTGGLVGYFGHNNSSGFDYNSVMTDCHVLDVTIENDAGMIGGLLGGSGYNVELIEGCTAENVSVTTGGSSYNGARAGGLIGYANGGKVDCVINDCAVTGASSISGKSNINNYGMGGLIGIIGQRSPYKTLTVQSCSSQADVTGDTSGQTQNGYYGGLVGRVQDGNSTYTATVIDACFAVGEVISCHNDTGGLVGHMEGVIKNSYAEGEVKSEKYRTGGLVGSLLGSIENSYASGDVTGRWKTGGLAGDIDGGKVRESYALGNVMIDRDEYGGGLIGYCWQAEVEDCYSKGDVVSIGAGGTCAAGLIGCAEDSMVKNSYSKGRVSAESTGEPTVSGLIGNGDSGTTVLNCYYDKDTSCQTYGWQVSGAEHDGISGLGTEDMTHSNLAYYLNEGGSNDIWAWQMEDNDGYPYLGTPVVKELKYTVKFNIRLDDAEWVNSGKTYRLTKNGGIDFVDPSEITEDGTYDIYEGGTDTRMDVRVSGGNVSVDMDYYTVTFFDGDLPLTSAGQASQAIMKGERAVAPAEPSRPGNRFTGWYSDKALTQLFNFANTVTAPLKLYASWAFYGGISGTVTDKLGPVSGVSVEVREGGTGGSLIGSPAVTETDGTFRFAGLPSGIYSLVASRTSENHTQIITRTIQVMDTVTSGDIFMPEGLKNTIVEVEPGTPPIAVDKLDELFKPENLVAEPYSGVTAEDVGKAAGGGTVEIKLTARQMNPSDSTVRNEVERLTEAIKAGKESYILRLTVEKRVSESGTMTGTTTKLTKLPQLIDIFVPIRGIGEMEGIQVLRIHGGQIQELPFDGESFEIGEDYLILHVKSFSTYMIAFAERQDNTASLFHNDEGDSSDLGIAGRWILGDAGWWYEYGDRTWASDGWYYLYWNDRYYWYHFNKMGYIDTGWFTDKEGKVYYLHPYHDGSQGYMYTGWNQIDGSWYYFEEKAGHDQGVLYRLKDTPDGYPADESGKVLIP